MWLDLQACLPLVPFVVMDGEFGKDIADMGQTSTGRDICATDIQRTPGELLAGAIAFHMISLYAV